MLKGQMYQLLRSRRGLAIGQYGGNFLITGHIGQAVGAQKPNVPRRFENARYHGTKPLLGAHCLGNHIAIGMAARLLLGNRARAQHFAHH